LIETLITVSDKYLSALIVFYFFSWVGDYGQKIFYFHRLRLLNRSTFLYLKSRERDSTVLMLKSWGSSRNLLIVLSSALMVKASSLCSEAAFSFELEEDALDTSAGSSTSSPHRFGVVFSGRALVVLWRRLPPLLEGSQTPPKIQPKRRNWQPRVGNFQGRPRREMSTFINLL